MRQYVRRLLESHYQVDAVSDGEAALEAVSKCQPDLVLTDVMMPRLDGFALLRRLRAEAKTQGIPVILLSARAGEESRVEGLEAGADDYLVKPFSARELLARVESHLKLAQLRRSQPPKYGRASRVSITPSRSPMSAVGSGTSARVGCGGRSRSIGRWVSKRSSSRPATAPSCGTFTPQTTRCSRRPSSGRWRG